MAPDLRSLPAAARWQRRRFLACAAASAAWLAAAAWRWAPPGALAAALPAAPPSPLPDPAGRPRELWITRPEAQETTRTVYWADGALQADGYRSINRIYRDLQAGVERPISVGLLHLNYAMQQAVARAGAPRPLVLLSGFRTAQTNRRVGGVEPSAHQSGEADDFIFEGLSLADNVRLARRFQVGGLGVYPDRGSLHKDLGARRTWIEFGRPQAADPGPVRINPEARALRSASCD